MVTIKKNFLIWLIVIFLSACGGSKETVNQPLANAVNQNANSTSPTPPSAADLADKNKIEEALKKEGFKDVTVDISTIPPTLRGTVAKDKMAIAILVAQKAAGKKLENGLTEK